MNGYQACFYWRTRDARCIERAVLWIGATPETIAPGCGVAFCAEHARDIVDGIALAAVSLRYTRSSRDAASLIMARLGGEYWRFDP